MAAALLRLSSLTLKSSAIEAVPARERHCSLAVAWREDGLGRTETLERERADFLKRRPAFPCESPGDEERAAQLATEPLNPTLQPVSPSAPL